MAIAAYQECAMRIADGAQQVLGGAGYVEDHPA